MDDSISRVGALSEPLRRDLYAYVVRHGGDVTRDQSAADLGISRSLAAFHLDKLVEEGLLEVSFRRLNGRTGPGAGRPSKLYRRAGRQLEVSLPPRQYELAAELLAQAVENARSPETLETLAATASSFGERVGEEARKHSTHEGDEGDRLAAAADMLAGYGFEPYSAEDGSIRLRNCPFHSLAQQHRALVCGMNLSLMQGVIAGLQVQGIEAALDPQPGMCCVVFRTRESRQTE
jgi:predicted ArsR family transcriptional regulator